MNEVLTKKPRVIPTPKQRKAARAIVENLTKDKPQTQAVVLANIGYSKGITETPSMVTESRGFKLALAELGLTEDLITTSLVEDIKKKPQRRIQELKLGAEVLGMVKREEPNKTNDSKNTYNFIFSQNVQERVRAIDSEIKNLLTQKHNETITDAQIVSEPTE